MSTTKEYIINTQFAKGQKIPYKFIGRPLKTTLRAVYIYGKGIYNNKQVIIDKWIPNKVILRAFDTKQTIAIPKEHKKLKPQYKKVVKKIVKLNNDNTLKIIFPFDWDTVNKVKTIPNATYSKTNKYWTCSNNKNIVKQLYNLGFTIDQEIINQYKALPKATVNPNLYQFQKEGVHFIFQKNGRCLIADEMGLGKTIQALEYLNIKKDIRPAIIVAPACALLNWKKETIKWITNPEVEVITGTKVYPTTGKILIINYTILKNWAKYLLGLKPQILILDECHYIKNNKSSRTTAAKLIGKGTPHVIGLSGTPIVNRPIELLNIVNLIGPHIFPSRWEFLMRYCGAKHNGFGWDFNGASNCKELNQILTGTCMIRRLKKDKLKDLPDKIFSYVPFNINNKLEYKEADKDLIQWLKNTQGKEKAEKVSHAEKIAKFNYLKQLAVKGKLEEMTKWILNFLEGGNEKLGIFTWHTNTIQTLYKKLTEKGYDVVYIDGNVSMANRQIAQDAFQNGTTRVFIGQMIAAGTNLTLTAASHCVVTEFPWTPGYLKQAIDRFHRITQKNAVNVYYMISKNTIEEKIVNLLDQKTKTLDAVHDGIDTDQGALITELIKNYVES